MKSRILMALIMSTFPTFAFAHNGVNHGKPVQGTIKSLSSDSLVISGEKGDVQISLQAETTYVGESQEKHVSKSDLKPGTFLMVYGTKLENGEVVAKEVMIHGSHEQSSR